MAKQRKVRVFVGTRKGGYVAESDRNRKKWKVRGPFQPGREVYHIAPDPRHEGRVYAGVNTYLWGPMLFASRDWGAHWEELAPPLMEVQAKRPPIDFSNPQPPVRPIVNIWHLEPGPDNEPKTVFVGVDPASLYRSDDLGASWRPVPGLNEHPTRPQWNPGAGGLCLHTLLIDPKRPKRMYAGISAAGTFRTDDGGERWKVLNRGVVVDFLPNKEPEVGQCVHKIALDPANGEVVYRQDHNGIFVSRDAAESWTRIGKPLPYDFGFVVAAPRARPGEAYFVPVDPESRLTLNGGLQVYRWSEKSRKFQPTVKGKPWAGEFGTHREGLAADTTDPPGLYLGTTTGDLFVSPDGARSWLRVPYYFPGIHSVSVSSPER